MALQLVTRATMNFAAFYFFMVCKCAYGFGVTLDYFWLQLGYNCFCNLSLFCVSEDLTYIMPLLLQLFINQSETLQTSYTCPVHVKG